MQVSTQTIPASVCWVPSGTRLANWGAPRATQKKYRTLQDRLLAAPEVL